MQEATTASVVVVSLVLMAVSLAMQDGTMTTFTAVHRISELAWVTGTLDAFLLTSHASGKPTNTSGNKFSCEPSLICHFNTSTHRLGVLNYLHHITITTFRADLDPLNNQNMTDNTLPL